MCRGRRMRGKCAALACCRGGCEALDEIDDLVGAAPGECDAATAMPVVVDDEVTGRWFVYLRNGSGQAHTCLASWAEADLGTHSHGGGSLPVFGLDAGRECARKLFAREPRDAHRQMLIFVESQLGATLEDVGLDACNCVGIRIAFVKRPA